MDGLSATSPFAKKKAKTKKGSGGKRGGSNKASASAPTRQLPVRTTADPEEEDELEDYAALTSSSAVPHSDAPVSPQIGSRVRINHVESAKRYPLLGREGVVDGLTPNKNWVKVNVDGEVLSFRPSALVTLEGGSGGSGGSSGGGGRGGASGASTSRRASSGGSTSRGGGRRSSTSTKANGASSTSGSTSEVVGYGATSDAHVPAVAAALASEKGKVSNTVLLSRLVHRLIDGEIEGLRALQGGNPANQKLLEAFTQSVRSIKKNVASSVQENVQNQIAGAVRERESGLQERLQAVSKEVQQWESDEVSLDVSMLNSDDDAQEGGAEDDGDTEMAEEGRGAEAEDVRPNIILLGEKLVLHLDEFVRATKKGRAQATTAGDTEKELSSATRDVQFGDYPEIDNPQSIIRNIVSAKSFMSSS